MATKLKQSELASKKRKLGMWLGLPEAARQEYKTQKELATYMGVTQKTLTKWRSDPDVQAIAQDALKILGGDRMMEVIKALMDSASGDSSHSPQDRRTVMEWQGLIGTKRGAGQAPTKFEVTFTTDKNGD